MTKIVINKYKIFLTLFIISLISSAILSLTQLEEICDIEQGCSIVQHSPYAYTLGIKNSHFGVILFSLLIIITILQIKNPSKTKKKIITIGIIFGSIIALYFIYLQQFVLKAYCKYCMTVDISMLLALLILIIQWKK